ncbi:hypothetical protein NGI11_16985 [Pseudomonas fulva]|nr:hypothetical protein [Pseudomonas fulva]
MFLPERLEPMVELGTEVDLPEILEHSLGLQTDLIVLVIETRARAITVKAGQITEQVAVVLVMNVETVHDQLRQCEGLDWRVQVLPAAEGARAALGGIETVEVDLVRV